MNTFQNTFIDLLLAGINHEYRNITLDTSIKPEEIYEEALAHQVHTILYPVLYKLCKEHNLHKAFMEQIHQEFLQDIALLEAHVRQVKQVLYQFHQHKIPVILLKGLVLRDYYPSPELRYMGDGDILVLKKDFERAKELLLSLGYKPSLQTLKHVSFRYKFYPEIEVHWILSDDDLEGGNPFTDEAWKHAVPTFFQDIPVFKLSIQDQILHLLLHASGHMKSGGFGIRQLCDIYLYLQVHMEDINWESLLSLASSHHINQFTCALLAICQKLFHLNLPLQLNIDENYLDLFIDDIFEAGVYGCKTKTRTNSTKILKYKDDDIIKTVNKSNKLRFCIRFLFPPKKKLVKNYPYLLNHSYLLPIAWLHRIFRNIFKLTSFKLNKDLKEMNEKRLKLLLWLQLH